MTKTPTGKVAKLTKKDKSITGGLTVAGRKKINRVEGRNLKPPVTGKVKKGSKASKRRKSFCARSKGQQKLHKINCKKTPKKRLCLARKKWKC